MGESSRQQHRAAADHELRAVVRHVVALDEEHDIVIGGDGNHPDENNGGNRQPVVPRGPLPEGGVALALEVGISEDFAGNAMQGRFREWYEHVYPRSEVLAGV